MDDIQKILMKMIKERPLCIYDRKQFRAVLLDYLPQNKLQQNLILNAYDEDIIEKLKPSSDVTLHALQMVKLLSDEYGLTRDYAMWSVISWCHMLSLGEIAEVIQNMFSAGETTQNATQPNGISAPHTVTVGFGIYKAGVDIPSGELKIKLNEKSTYKVYYGISKNPNGIDTNESFRTQTYITIEDGHYLKLECMNTGNKYTITITKV